MVTAVVLFAATESMAACTVLYWPLPSDATVLVLPPLGGVLADSVRFHCMRAMSEQVSCTIGLLPAVEPSWSLTHSPLSALVITYLPAAAADAENDHVWLVLDPHV